MKRPAGGVTKSSLKAKSRQQSGQAEAKALRALARAHAPEQRSLHAVHVECERKRSQHKRHCLGRARSLLSALRGPQIRELVFPGRCPLSCGVARNAGALQNACLAEVVWTCAMQDAAVIPDQQVTWRPAM